MRDRLIELLSVPIHPREGADPAEVVADYLLDNGVIALPCKAGDTVYVISKSRISEGIVSDIYVFPEINITLEVNCDYDCGGCPFSDWTQSLDGDCSCSGEYGASFVKEKDFGKTVFLTREEAEEALKRGNDEG